MDLVQSFGVGGVVVALLGAVVTLVKIAISAERRVSGYWREAFQTSNAANAVLTGHLDRIVSTVDQMATTQRETLALVQAMAAEKRSAA